MPENTRYQLLVSDPPGYRVFPTPFHTIDVPQVQHFYFQNNQYLPSEGWELINRNLGFDNTADRPRLGNGFNNPYFILYNKFTGTLRVFTIVRDSRAGGQKLGINLELGGLNLNKSLSFSGPLSPVIADPTPVNQVLTSISLYNNSAEAWHYADFFIGYDPCVCLFSSDLQVRIRVVVNSTLQITGSLQGIIKSMDLTSSSSESRTLDGTQFFSNLGNVGKQGAEFFKNGDEWVTNNKPFLDQVGPTAYNDALKFISGSKTSKFLKAGFEALPVISDIFDIFSAFVGGGSTAPLPVQIMPMSIDAKLNLNGTITQNFDFGGPSMSMPGSLNAGPGEKYPYYNEPLGVFTLLERPALAKRVVYRSTLGPPYVSRLGFTLRQDYLTQIKLASPLKYVVNPSANLEVVQIRVAIVLKKTFRLDGNQWLYISDLRPNSTQLSQLPPNTSYLWDNAQIVQHLNFDKDKDRTRYFDAGHSRYSSLWIRSGRPLWNLSTQNMTEDPVNYLKDTMFVLKVMVTMRRTDAAATQQTQNVLHYFTYPIQFITAQAGFDWQSPDDLLPNTVDLRNYRDYSEPDRVEAISAEPIQINEYTVEEQNPDYTYFYLTTPNVVYSARNGDPLTTLHPRIIHIPLHPEARVTPQATPAEVSLVCNNSLGYREAVRPRKGDSDDKLKAAAESNDREASPLVLSPNPAADRVAITFHQEQFGAITVTVRDILGQPLLQQVFQGLLPNCEQRVEINTSSLSTGLYIVTVAVDGRQLQSRLSIQR